LKWYKKIKFKTLFLTCDQIWLIPLVDDCQFAYITKIGQKQKQNKNSRHRQGLKA
jgi:hypothetical protein